LATLPAGFTGSLLETSTGIFVSYGGITTVYWKAGPPTRVNLCQLYKQPGGHTPLTQAVSAVQNVIFSANTPANEGNTVLAGILQSRA